VTGPGKPEDSFFHFSNPKQKKNKRKNKKIKQKFQNWYLILVMNFLYITTPSSLAI
jgi:hypothetical protein